tara:strand:+ start:259 stop:441 length:183 start_codon:yes stop_codon:yes gene_type:complete
MDKRIGLPSVRISPEHKKKLLLLAKDHYRCTKNEMEYLIDQEVFNESYRSYVRRMGEKDG